MRLSIIVPVYNAEKFLCECIDSIINQTMVDFELILVDDGSSDGSGAICDAYAAADSRIQVMHVPNGGVSRARNLGIDRARGEYIMFADSDDELSAEYVAHLMALCARDFEGSSAYVKAEVQKLCRKHPLFE